MENTRKVQFNANLKAVRIGRNEEENRFKDVQCKNTFAFIVFVCYLHYFLIQFEFLMYKVTHQYISEDGEKKERHKWKMILLMVAAFKLFRFGNVMCTIFWGDAWRHIILHIAQVNGIDQCTVHRTMNPMNRADRCEKPSDFSTEMNSDVPARKWFFINTGSFAPF